MTNINAMKIKNLAIALEALSRINGYHNLMQDIKNLLQEEITRAQEHPPKSESTTADDDTPF